MSSSGLQQDSSTVPTQHTTPNNNSNFTAMQNTQTPVLPDQWAQLAMMSQNPFQSNSPWPQSALNATNTVNGTPSQQGANGFNPFFSMLPQNLIQDVLRMSQPIGSAPNDDVLLVQALQNSEKRGQTYKQAIESLHGVNNHAANLWKDYYLDHKPRIDGLVVGRPLKTAKKPSSLTASTSKPKRSSRTVSSSPKPNKDSRSSSKTRDTKPTPHRSRNTINSLTAHPLIRDVKKLPPPHASIEIPEPPSRSPTPPTRVVRGFRGNRYTDEDKEYFVKYISWELKCNPDLNKSELCEKLAEKVPHHTAQSWSSHWHSRHDIADKILAAARGEESDESGQLVAEEDIETAEDESQSSSEEDEWHSESSGVDENSMGGPGDSITEGDIKVMVKYIASIPNWNELSFKERWNEFGRRHKQRSEKSWGEYYRTNERMIERKVRKYKKYHQKLPIQMQRGRPTWASKTSKRRLPSDDDDYEEENEGESHSKRHRED